MKRAWPLAFLLLLLGIFIARLYQPPTPGPAPTSLRLQERVKPNAISPSIPSPLAAPVAQPALPPAPLRDPQPEGDADGWKMHPLMRSLVWLARRQNPDGSWGDSPVTLGGRTIGKTGISSLALLSFLGGGYSHLSNDEYDGTKMGETMKRGIEWLIRDLDPDGKLQSTYDQGFDQALGALALSESYGMTASRRFEAPATQALGALLRLQSPDGSWGSPEATAWAIKALISAELSDLPWDEDARNRALKYATGIPHPANVFSQIMVTKNKAPLEAEAAALADQFPVATSADLAPVYHATYSLFQYEGPDGRLWKRQNESIKDALVPYQQADGSWLGGTNSHVIVRSSLAQLTLQVYYRYANAHSTSR